MNINKFVSGLMATFYERKFKEGNLNNDRSKNIQNTIKRKTNQANKN